MRDGLIHYSGYLAQSIAGFFLIPFLNRNLATEDYGLWVFATGAAVFPALFDFGLFWAVTRSVSQGRSLPTEVERAQSIAFVHNAGRAYGVIGMLGGLGLLLASGPLSETLKLTRIPPRIIFGVFLFTALNFITEELMAYGSAVLQGLRRFDLTNIVRAFTVIVRSVGIAVVVIHLRNMNNNNGMHAAVIWNLIGGIIGTIFVAVLIHRVAPEYQISFGIPDWSSLKTQLSFGATSLCITLLLGIVWNAPPMLLGFLLGPAAIIPYHLGKSFPNSLSWINYRTAEVLFPSASESVLTNDSAMVQRAVESGTRWAIVLMLGPAIVLMALAPQIITLWLGRDIIASAQVLRWMSAAVLAESLGAASLHVMWGLNRTRPILLVLSGMVVVQLAFAWKLVPLWGAVGAAIAFFVSMTAGWIIFAILGAGLVGGRFFSFLEYVFTGLLIPAISCAGVAVALVQVLPKDYGANVVLAAIAAGLVYLLIFFALGTRPEEKTLIDQLLAGKFRN